MIRRIKNILKRLVVVLALVQLAVGLGFAAYFERIPTVVVDPDGSKIECFSSGDEYYNYLHDADGYTIIQGSDGYYYYATLSASQRVVPSTYKVNSTTPAKAGLMKNVRITEEEYQQRVKNYWKDVDITQSRAPHQGTMNNLVIYIRFNDDSEFTTPRSTFDSRFNPSDVQSLKNYFNEVSYGQLNIESYHYPVAEMNTNLSYKDENPRNHFRPYNATSNTIGYQTDEEQRIREHSLLMRAINAVKDQIPEDMVIDADNDGRVDNVCFIVRGNAEGWADLLWAHRWVLYTYDVRIHGKRVYDYTFQPENQSDIYTICHEMFHTLGAPDLYRYSGSGYTPVGPWDLMASGFVHMGAYMKRKYTNGKWISNIPTISEPGDYTLNPLTSSENNAYRINSPNSSSEYFVVEYRKQEGLYESNLPGSGLLVYRIIPSINSGNMNGPPDEVYLYRVGGTNSVNGSINMAHFSQNTGRTAINDASNPSSFLSNGNPGGLDISKVTEAGETITFSLFAGGYAITLKAEPWTAGSVYDITNQGPYQPGTEVTLQAVPVTGFGFVKWTINGETIGTSSTFVYTMPESHVEITGHFQWGYTSATTSSLGQPSIAPNPFSNTITISSIANFKEVTITNLIGQEVFRSSLSGNSTYEINTSTLRPGVYLLTLKGKSGERVVRRLVKN